MRAYLTSIGAAIVVLAGLVVVAPDASAATPSILYAGQSLTARTASDELVSSSGEFTLAVSPDELVIEERQHMATGDTITVPTWYAEDFTGRYQSNYDHSRLVMQTDGNLVLYTAGGHALWSSGTRGTGSHNRILMQNNGNLAMYTSAGKAVWGTHTTGILLASGHELLSGQRMINRWGYWLKGAVAWTLFMEPNGNLVLYCGNTVRWSTHTYVAGSHLTMGRNGNLGVVTPAGHLTWQSRTGYLGPASWMHAGGGITVTSTTHGPVNVTPSVSDC